MSASTFTLCDTRKRIIAEESHLLITGGPGCGKTTVALLKAKRRARSLLAGQAVLFLSFSRAAVQQIRDRTRDILSREDRRRVEISTYHLFCLRVLEAHGRLLNGRAPRILYPSDERLMKAEDPDGWKQERERLAAENGLYVFDLFAPAVASLLERSAAVRGLLASRYPLVVLDEFQDTNNDQWRLVRALAKGCQVACLADPDQRIFEYQGNIDPKRLDILREELQPKEFDLGEENHRSPRGDIVRFANAILRGVTLPKSSSVQLAQVNARGDAWAIAPQARVQWLFSELVRAGIAEPSIAVLARTNDAVSRLSMTFRRENHFAASKIPPIHHQIVWDGELATAAGQVVASVMEWEGVPWREGAVRTLELVSNYFRMRFAGDQTKKAAQAAADFSDAAAMLRHKERIRTKAPRTLAQKAEQQTPLLGAPLDDWRMARAIVTSVPKLEELGEASRMLRLFRATDRLAAGLQAIWLRQGSYVGAAKWLKHAVESELLLESQRPPRGCMLMNMHKSKGKEFDAVVIAEQPHRPLIAEGKGEAESRRLLRVAITRARHKVVITRPYGAPRLVG